MIKRSVAIGAAAACVAAGAALTLVPSSATAASSGAVAVTPSVTWGTDGKVYTMTKVGNTIYVAGKFSNLVNIKSGIKQPAANIGAIDATTGKPITGFTAGTDGLIYSVRASADGSTLYVGGSFSAADGVARKNLAAFNSSTGAITPWAPKATVDVRAVLPLGDKVIVGGDFTYLNGAPVQRIGAVDTVTGATYPGWSTSATCRVQALAATPDGQSFYAGGYAQYWNGAYQPGLVRMSASTGQLDPTFNAHYAPNQVACDPIHKHGGNNPFTIEVQPTGNLAVAIGGTTNLLDMLSSHGGRIWRDSADGDFQAVTVLGDYVYAGGHFRSHVWDACGNSFVPEHIVRLNLRNGCVDSSWGAYMYPHDLAGHYYGTWVLINDGSTIYAGGEFTSTESNVNGTWVFTKSPSYAVFRGLTS